MESFRRARVVVVEDDRSLALVVARYLGHGGFEPCIRQDGESGLAQSLDAATELVVLDLSLPRLDGTVVLSRLRAVSGVPVIVLSSRSDDATRVRMLLAGADDFVPKPFSPRELLARVQAVLRRTGQQRSAPEPVTLACRDVEVEVHSRRVRRGGEPVELTPLEFDFLELLVRHPDRTFTRPELGMRVWGDRFCQVATIRALVHRLREKLAPSPSAQPLIATVRGVGYRLEC
ncbi:MAG: response regulator transcription factor [Egibacteraceae bacterium]